MSQLEERIKQKSFRPNQNVGAQIPPPRALALSTKVHRKKKGNAGDIATV